MKKQYAIIMLLLVFSWLLPTLLWAASLDATGVWRTVNAKGQARSLVRIQSVGGVLHGRVIQILPGSGRGPDAVCDQCRGALHNKRIMGMTVLWGLKPSGDGWTGGSILDTETGNIYRCDVCSMFV